MTAAPGFASKRLVVFGASGHGAVVADAASLAGFDVLGFADDDPAKAGLGLLDWSVVAIGVDAVARLCREARASVVVSIGSNRARQVVLERLVDKGLSLATIVHPTATISRFATLGAGTVVFAGVIVNAGARIGSNVILNTAASIDHDNVIGDHAHVSPGARLGGTVCVGTGTHVGIGAAVRNNLRIGAWTLVGAGSVVVKDIPDHVVAFGNPARVVRENRP